MTGRLAGKVALITGAARGQGEAEARRFVDEGAAVMLTDVLDEAGQAVAAGLPGSAYLRLDVTDPAAWDAAVRATVDRFGGLDILVNNAGIYRRGPLEATDPDGYMEVIRINQFGTFLGMRAVVASMRARGGGTIVNISSAAGMVGSVGLVAYTASKWAVRGMTKVAALELAADGIRVNSVHPGLIDTDMVRSGVGARAEALVANVPLGRVGTVDETTELVLYLASPESGYCTGSEFVIDGGATAGRKAPPPS